MSTRKRRPPAVERQASQLGRRCATAAAAALLAGAFATPASAAPGEDDPPAPRGEGIEVARGPAVPSGQVSPHPRGGTPRSERTQPGTGQLDRGTGRVVRDAENFQNRLSSWDVYDSWTGLKQKLDEYTNRDVFGRPTGPVPMKLDDLEPVGYLNAYNQAIHPGALQLPMDMREQLDRDRVAYQMGLSYLTKEQRAPYVERFNELISQINRAATNVQRDRAIAEYNKLRDAYNEREYVERRDFGGNVGGLTAPKSHQRPNEDLRRPAEPVGFERYGNQPVGEAAAPPGAQHWSLSPEDRARAEYGLDPSQDPGRGLAGVIADSASLAPNGSLVSGGYPGLALGGTDPSQDPEGGLAGVIADSAALAPDGSLVSGGYPGLALGGVDPSSALTGAEEPEVDAGRFSDMTGAQESNWADPAAMAQSQPDVVSTTGETYGDGSADRYSDMTGAQESNWADPAAMAQSDPNTVSEGGYDFGDGGDGGGGTEDSTEDSGEESGGTEESGGEEGGGGGGEEGTTNADGTNAGGGANGGVGGTADTSGGISGSGPTGAGNDAGLNGGDGGGYGDSGGYGDGGGTVV